jgi:hypothetical protein
MADEPLSGEGETAGDGATVSTGATAPWLQLGKARSTKSSKESQRSLFIRGPTEVLE